MRSQLLTFIVLLVAPEHPNAFVPTRIGGRLGAYSDRTFQYREDAAPASDLGMVPPGSGWNQHEENGSQREAAKKTTKSIRVQDQQEKNAFGPLLGGFAALGVAAFTAFNCDLVPPNQGSVGGYEQTSKSVMLAQASPKEDEINLPYLQQRIREAEAREGFRLEMLRTENFSERFEQQVVFSVAPEAPAIVDRLKFEESQMDFEAVTAKRSAATEGKLLKMSNEELADIITRDVQENQFLVRADLTRAVYDESATFTDEIDTYQLDQWIKGTKRLFVAEKSHVNLVPGSVKVTESEASFLFTEYLTFNIPFLQPKVYLSGKVILQRNLDTGLIMSYQEKWDQDVNTVLLSAQFGGK